MEIVTHYERKSVSLWSVFTLHVWSHGLYSPPGSSYLWNSPGQNTGVGSHSLLQGIFPTQGSNQGLLHIGRFFYIWAIRDAQTIHYYVKVKWRINRPFVQILVILDTASCPTSIPLFFLAVGKPVLLLFISLPMTQRRLTVVCWNCNWASGFVARCAMERPRQWSLQREKVLLKGGKQGDKRHCFIFISLTGFWMGYLLWK